MSKIDFELTEIVNEATMPVAGSIGNTLGSLWDICFGWIDAADEKIRYKRALEVLEYKQDLLDFKKVLDDEINSIPLNKLLDPPLEIVGPSFEALKFFLREKKLRSYFAKLIAKSMNEDMAPYVHASFVEIIRQMSPLDAKIIEYFIHRETYPIAQYQKPREDGYDVVHPLVFLHDICTEENVKQVAISISNLCRLGLLECTFLESVSNKREYDRYYLAESLRFSKDDPEEALEVDEGVVGVTSYGAAFIFACVAK